MTNTKLTFLCFLLALVTAFHNNKALRFEPSDSFSKIQQLPFSSMNSWPPRAGRQNYGPGISQSQAELISGFISNASSAYQDDKFNNAIYIQDVLEKNAAFSGMWTVEIVESSAAEEWKLAGEARNGQWFMVSNFGEYGWTYRVWTPNC